MSTGPLPDADDTDLPAPELMIPTPAQGCAWIRQSCRRGFVVGIGVDEPVWDHSVFSNNRDRLLEGAIAARFLSTLLTQPKVKRLLSTDHFSVDGTLVQAWASMKSFKPIDGPDEPPPPTGGRNVETNFRGETRSNTTHACTTDPDAKLYRKGPGMEAKLAFLGHALMENRKADRRGPGPSSLDADQSCQESISA